MFIRFLCPSGHRIKADARLHGQAAACPACGTQVTVPNPTPKAITESAAFQFLNEGAAETDTPAPRPAPVHVAQTKQCPRCKTAQPVGTHVCPSCRLLFGPSVESWKNLCRDALRTVRGR